MLRSESIRAFDVAIAHLKQRIFQDSTLVTPSDQQPPSGVNAAHLLIGWRDMLDAIRRPDGEQETVRRLNDAYDGPILIRQGAKPLADKIKLIEWWNSLLERVKNIEDRKRDELASIGTNASYQHGTTSSMVVPDISGVVKKRRIRPDK